MNYTHEYMDIMEYENREHQATQHIIEDMAAQVQREKMRAAV